MHTYICAYIHVCIYIYIYQVLTILKSTSSTSANPLHPLTKTKFSKVDILNVYYTQLLQRRPFENLYCSTSAFFSPPFFSRGDISKKKKISAARYHIHWL